MDVEMVLRALALVTFFIFATAVAAEEPAAKMPLSPPNAQSTPITGGNQNHPADDKKSASPKAPVLHAPEAPQDQDARRDRDGAGDRVGTNQGGHSDAELTIANFTIALAIATFILAVATFFLAWYTRGVQKETKRLADEAVKQGEKTEEQVRIASETAKAAQTSASAAERALIGAETPLLTPELDILSGPIPSLSPHTSSAIAHIIFNWKNVGKAIAFLYEVTPTIERVTYYADIQKESIFGLNLFAQVVPPNCSNDKTSFEIQAYPVDPLEAEEKRERLTILSLVVRYADVFENQYLTRYCYAIDTEILSFRHLITEKSIFRRPLTDEEIRKIQQTR